MNYFVQILSSFFFFDTGFDNMALNKVSKVAERDKIIISISN